MKAKTLIATTAVALTGLFASNAAALTPTEVTIKGTDGDYHGVVKSSDAAECAEGRKVTVFKMAGGSPNPGSDLKIGSDTASFSGGKYRWSIGNSGYKDGHFYARVRKTDTCGGDLSPVING